MTRGATMTRHANSTAKGWRLALAGASLLALVIATTTMTGELGSTWAWTTAMISLVLGVTLLTCGLASIVAHRLGSHA